jgi:hypothetical protein
MFIYTITKVKNSIVNIQNQIHQQCKCIWHGHLTVSSYSKGIQHHNLSFHTKTLNHFLIGCIISLIFCILSVGHGSLKRILLPYLRFIPQLCRVNILSMRIFKTVNYIIGIVLKFLTMFLMMTMNGYVSILIDIGLSNYYRWHLYWLLHISA